LVLKKVHRRRLQPARLYEGDYYNYIVGGPNFNCYKYCSICLLVDHINKKVKKKNISNNTA